MASGYLNLPSHVVDLAAGELRSLAGDPVDLRPRSFAVLRLLAENAGRLVTKDAIITAVWTEVTVTEDSLTQCVADIRKAIGDEDRRVLRNVQRQGYVLVPARCPAQWTGRVPDLPSLAVMPFAPLGDEVGLGLGVASQIINELARNRDLRLLARDSSFALASRNLSPQEIGERLGVRYLVGGTIEQVNGRLLIDVQLVDAIEGTIAWGDRFSAAAADIPHFQREVAARIAGSLRSSMRAIAKHEILSVGPRDLDVYSLTLRGIARKHQFSPEATRAARVDLEEAIRRDCNYAPAWTYLAWTNLLDILLGFTGEWQFAHLAVVISQFNRAIELDPSFSTPYQGLSHALIYTGDLRQSLSLARRAVELGPGDADGLLFLANALFESGQLAEAMGTARRAVELNPLRPPYYYYFNSTILWGNECYQEALEEADECLRNAPYFGPAGFYRALALVGLGRIDEAKVCLSECIAKGMMFGLPHPPELAGRATAALQSAGWRPSLVVDRKAG